MGAKGCSWAWARDRVEGEVEGGEEGEEVGEFGLEAEAGEGEGEESTAVNSSIGEGGLERGIKASSWGSMSSRAVDEATDGFETVAVAVEGESRGRVSYQTGGSVVGSS